MDDLTSFDNFCIVCDRLIVPVPEPEPETKPTGRKKAQGAIRIRNPDGTTTTRTANGVKTTRPMLRRPGSTMRLAAAPAAGGNKPRPTTPALSASTSGSSDGQTVVTPTNPEPPTCLAPQPTSKPEPPFVSNIYCSKACMDKDHGDSTTTCEDMARAFGFGLVASPIQAPASPLLSSDTDSYASGVAAAMLGPRMGTTPDGMASSVPRTIDYFRIARDQPDDAWREAERQRRSSAAGGVRPFEPVHVTQQHLQMARQRSAASGTAQSTTSGASSDSLSSLWHDGEAVHRTLSNNGAMRAMTPLYTEAPAQPTGPTHRSMSSSSDGSAAGPTRPLPRSAMSQTSLGGLTSPTPILSPEFGSVPSQTAFLMQSYASAFPMRDPCLSPSLKPATPDSRSASVAMPTAPALRQTTGTIRARPRTGSGNASWDAFGKAECRERSRRGTVDSDIASSLPRASPLSPEFDRGRPADATPRQSLEVENGAWQIRYAAAPGRPSSSRATSYRTTSRSRSRSRTREADSNPNVSPIMSSAATTLPLALPIPVRPRSGPAVSALASSNTTATGRSRTPRHFASASASGRGTPGLPDIAGLRIGSACASAVMTPELATSPPASRSIPRAGFDWDKRGAHTYELPKGVVVNPNKGLFYFNA